MSDKDDKGNDISGTNRPRWGVSVFDYEHFFGFSTRNAFTTKQGDAKSTGVSLLEKGGKESKMTSKPGEVVPDITADVINEIKTKKIPKNAIIVFDEGHLDKSDYQEEIRDIITSGYRVIKMSATFKGIPFSITTTFPRKNLYMNYIPAKYKLEKEEEVDFDKKLAKSRTQIFLRDVNNVNVEALVAKNIPHAIIDSTNEAYYESITHGMPDGSLIIVDNTREMGYTPKVDIVVVSGWTQYPILQSTWKYTDPEPSRISISSLVQQIGRVARIDYGTAIILSKALEEPTPKDGVSVFTVRAALTGDEAALKKVGFKKDINLLRACVSFPGESDKKEGKFGLPPEVLIVGATGIETVNFLKVKFNRDMLSFPEADETLIAKHKLEWTPPPLNEKEAKEILKLMIQTYIEKSKDFPHQLEITVKTALIEELDQGQGENKAPGKGEYRLTEKEVEQIFHTVIKSKLVETDPELDTNPNKLEWPASDKDIFNKIVAIHRLALGAKISIPERPIDPDKPDKGTAKVVEINYPESDPATQKKAIFEVDEKKIVKIRSILRKANLNSINEVKEALKKDTLEGYEILAIELKTSPLCNRLVDEIGTNRANRLVFKLEKVIKKNSLNEFKANIEVGK